MIKSRSEMGNELLPANNLYITDGAHSVKASNHTPGGYLYEKERADGGEGKRIPIKDANGENVEVVFPHVDISELGLMHFHGDLALPVGNDSFRLADIKRNEEGKIVGIDLSQYPGLEAKIEEAERKYWDDYKNRK